MPRGMGPESRGIISNNNNNDVHINCVSIMCQK